MTQTFTNPGSEPPNYAQAQGLLPNAGDNDDNPQAPIPVGLVTGSPSSVTLTSSPGSVTADVRLWVYGYGQVYGSSSLGSQLPPSWYQAHGAGPNLGILFNPAGVYAPPPAGHGLGFTLGWWLVAETTLSVGTPYPFAIPANVIPLTAVSALLTLAALAGVQQAPAGVPVQVPGYDLNTPRFYTQAGQPKYVRPPIVPPTPYTAFVSLVSPVAGNYNFSVS